MSGVVDSRKMDVAEEQEYARVNAPDCPSCESVSDTHVVKEGDEALRGNGIYCGVCESFVAELPEHTS